MSRISFSVNTLSLIQTSFDLRDFDRAIKETKIKNTEHTADELIIVNMWIFKIVP